MTTVHVIGAGVAGLACALRASLAGSSVVVYEASGHAGGRCRSFFDESLGCVLDTGTHILVGAYHATLAYLADIGARNAVHEVAPAAFPFVDITSGERWVLRPSPGRIPLWIAAPRRRVPGTRIGDYLAAMRLARAPAEATIADCIGRDGALYRRLWQPFAWAVLNTDPAEASARLMWRTISETFFKGEAACRPMLFMRGLSPALIDPALATLRAQRVETRFLSRLRGLRRQDDRIVALQFPEGMLRIEPGDSVVLAVPPEVAQDLWPELVVPTETRAIMNAHFRTETPIELPGGHPFLGIVGGTAQWIFAREHILSVTVSAADNIIERPNFELATHLWSDVARALGHNLGRVPPWRIVKEKRATITQTPASIALRPPAETSARNLFLAGDWTDTGLPATIESAVRSGYRAAQLALAISGKAV